MRYLWVFVLLALAGVAGAKEYASTMHFVVFQPCMGSASFCAPMVLAQGELDPAAPERLKALLQKMVGSPRIVFDSPGGNLVAGLNNGARCTKNNGARCTYGRARKQGSESTFRESTFRVHRDAHMREVVQGNPYALHGPASRTTGPGVLTAGHQDLSRVCKLAPRANRVIASRAAEARSQPGGVRGRRVAPTSAFAAATALRIACKVCLPAGNSRAALSTRVWTRWPLASVMLRNAMHSLHER